MAERLADNLWQLEIPLEGNPLKTLNSYLILGERSLLIDTGFRQRSCLEATLECIQLHEDYDVLAHLTYIAKTHPHPSPRPVPFEDHREIIDEILRQLAIRGKGLEMNTSGVDRCGGFLPTADYFRRFKELGGEIVTVGSDAHRCDRVGQYTFEACEILKEIFGHVCTFADRKPIFHKL